jgi:hypothetical protein
MNCSPTSRIRDGATIKNLVLCIAAHLDEARTTIPAESRSRAIDGDVTDSGICASVAIVPDGHFVAVRHNESRDQHLFALRLVS